MSNPFDDVRKFMEIAHPDKLPAVPGIPLEAVDELCQNLIDEELRELRKADADEDMVEIADAIADLIYVLIFKALCYGIPISKVWDEVSRTNLAKFPGGVVLKRPEDGKVLKPPDWVPPDIKRIIEEAKKLAAPEEP